MAKAIIPWSPEEETRLLIWAMAKKPLGDFARGRRSAVSVRLKLMRLRADPLTRPPEFTTTTTLSTDAAVPRVPSARGPNDTSDSA